MSDLREALKPCPFCGDHRIGLGYVRDGRRVFCANCMVGVCAFNPDAEKKAAERWNTRAALSAQPQPDAAYTLDQVVSLTYKNYRGDVALRHIVPKSLRYGSTEWHPEPQWLLLAWDADKRADREFALKDFGPPIAPDERMRRAILASIDMIENCADAPKNPDSLPEMVKVHLQQALSGAADASNASAEARLRAERAKLVEMNKCEFGGEGQMAIIRWERIDAIDHELATLSPAGADEGKESEGGRYTNTLCYACGAPQFNTPSGVTCRNGHGGADAAPSDPTAQREAIARIIDPVAFDNIGLLAHERKRKAVVKAERILALKTRAGG